MIKYIIAYSKIITAQLYVFIFGKKIVEQNVWIFSEKKTEARDNAYHFYKYIRTNHPNITAFYIIQDNSPDREKVKKIGKTISYNSLRHCILYYAAKYRICSQIHGVKPYEEVPGIRRIRIYRRNDQKQINLKHGISKDFRPDAFDFRKAHFDLYISAAKPEYDYIRKMFNYPEKNIALTGFCRFDALHEKHHINKTVLVMPTFRDWLRTNDSSKERASDTEAQKFLKSDYYRAYRDLLSNKELLQSLRDNDYNIVFYLHYTFQPYTYLFDELIEKLDIEKNRIIIAGRADYDVQELLMSSAVLITDFSSVFFDFAYMHKPIIYYQFDVNEYREKHYQEGYFSYERDGFGPVLYESQSVIEYLKKILMNNAAMEDQYMKRVEKFFIPYDNNNCKRVYDAIMRFENE